VAYEPWRPGMRMTANRLLSISPTWQDWTPAWTTSSGNNLPAFGNATVDCKYAQAALTVWWEMEITFGSSTTFGGGTGSDNWRFSAPVTSAETQLMAGYGEIQGSGGGERFPVRVRLTTTGTFEIELSGGAYNNISGASSGLIDAVTPFGAGSTGSTAWASGFAIRAQGHYQAAG